ncbi:hypothetical protein CBS101457_004667 [Exobasidium rhododendri]|nr:hypothetical protein CBS101457_004667 [Exobasidium rhododendri]
MQFLSLLLASLSVSVASAAPSNYDDALTASPAAPLYSWISTSLSQWIPSSERVASQSTKSLDVASEYAASLLASGGDFNPFEKPDYNDYSIWEVIQENEHLTDLKKVLKYSSPKSKDLLDDKSKKLTFLAPINWHHGKDHDEAAVAQWSPIQRKIEELENASLWSDSDEDKDRKERKKRAIAYLIDSILKYHVIESEAPLKAWDVAQNSSVSTLLNIGHGKAKEIVGNLWDGEQFRLRVGKSLLPRPSAYFNFYSRLVYPDVDVSGSIVHAISFPLFIPPSTLQALFFGQTQFSTLTSALQKVHAESYLKLPINSSYMHHHGHGSEHKSHHKSLSLLFGGENEHEHHHEHHHAKHGKGQGSLTLFAPSNAAWAKMPWKLRLYLFSPFGAKVLSYVLALHALPHTIFFADWVHEVASKSSLVKQYSVSTLDLHAQIGEVSYGAANVTEYTFDTACPKLHFNKTDHSWSESKGKFEQVDVKVYRYTILPGGKGPLQTRVSVNEVPVLFQDIPTANGGFHQIERLIMPKGHPKEGLWASVAQQAEQAGYGSIDLSEM